MEGNDGSQDEVCIIYFHKNQQVNFKKDVISCENDEARSAIIEGAEFGTKITVFDNPDGKTDDDFTIITVTIS